MFALEINSTSVRNPVSRPYSSCTEKTQHQKCAYPPAGRAATQRARVWQAILGMIMVIVGIVVASPPAFATFPGENGQIVYENYPPSVGGGLYLTGSGQLTFYPPDPRGVQGGDRHPAWSPFGDKIALERHDPVLGDELIDVINKDGTGRHQVISSDAFDQFSGSGHELSTISSPAWLPDGQGISFVHENPVILNNNGIWSVRSDGTGLTRLVSGANLVTGNSVDYPNWSIQGKMAYTCQFRVFGNINSPIEDICVYDANTRTIHHLPIDLPTGMIRENLIYIMRPKWMPDGEKIIFNFPYLTLENNHVVRRNDIFSINADGTGLTRLTFSPDACPDQIQNYTRSTIDYYPQAVPSPDGESIVANAQKNIATGFNSAHECSYAVTDFGLWTLSSNGGVGSLLVPTFSLAWPDWQPIPENLTFNIFDGHKNLLKGLKVKLRTLDGTVVDDNPIKAIGGKYVFANHGPGEYVLRATLVDHPGPPGSLPSFDIRYAPHPSEPVWVEYRFTVASSKEFYTINFTETDPNLVDYGPDKPSDASDKLDDMANIYFRVRQFVDWVKGTLTADTRDTVEFYTFATADPWGDETDPNVARAYYDPTETAIVFSTGYSEYANRDDVVKDTAPENGEWHEFTHHLYYTFVNPRTTCLEPYVNHAGYNNPDTCDSMDEGFATFLPTLAAHAIEGVSDANYDGFSFNLEVNNKAWGHWEPYLLDPTQSAFILDATREDFAVAALFWDLVDTNADTEYHGVIGADGSHHFVDYTDQVTLPLKQLWDQLTAAHPATVYDLRRMFGQTSLLLDLDDDGVEDVSSLDVIFLTHGFFPVDGDQIITDSHTTYHYDVAAAQRINPLAPRNGNVGLSNHLKYDDSTGQTVSFNPRPHTPLAPNANLGIHVLDASGTPLSGATVNMTIRYPGLEDTVSRHLESGDGALVHLELPAYFDYLLPTGAPLPACDPVHDFHVDVTVSATVNGVSSDTYSFDNCTYVQAVHAATGPAALSFTLTVPVNAGGTPEVCDGIDNDLDGLVDEEVLNTYYQDADNDTYGNASVTTQACTQAPGYVSDSTDCNDGAAAINPGAIEVCNLADDNCDGNIDEGVENIYYQDADSDTYGNLLAYTQACTQPAGYVSNSTDCNDTTAAIYPGAAEACNLVDDNCDGTIDEGVLNTYYQDADGDTFGTVSLTIEACSQPAGNVTDNTDCNDGNASINPGATEICNGLDDNCNSQTDEGVQATFYQDADADTYGNASVTTLACILPAGYENDSTDCNDGSASVHPGAPEVCGNSVDDDCDGQMDEGCSGTYNFSGFFQPVDNLPVLNSANAGGAIPVKFSLNGNQGLNIFASGYPASGVTACNSTDPVDTIEATVTAGGSSLTYDSTTDQYTYVWKTEKGWAGQCRQLNVNLNDGTSHIANFKFK